LSAAQAVTDTSTVIDMKVVTPEEFAFLNLNGVDVVVVESYPVLSAGSGAGIGFQKKLTDFVRGGGGVISLPDRG